jgi:hypothetical protein
MVISILLFNSIDVNKYIDKNIGWCLTFVGVYIYVWKLNQTVLELDFWAVNYFVLPSTGFEFTPLIHCSTIRLALRPVL